MRAATTVLREAVVRDAGRAALAARGLPNVRLTLLRQRRYLVYRVDDARGRRFVLRVRDDDGAIAPRAAEAQLRWLAAIDRETKLVVPAPVGKPQLLRIDVTDGLPRWAALLRWVDGRHISPPRRFVTRPVLAVVGRAAGELHRHSQTYALGRDRRHVPRWDSTRFFDHENTCVSRRGRKVFGPRDHDTLRRAVDRIRAALDDLGEGRAHFGLIHGDLEPPNWVFYQSKPRPIDFDEFGLGHYLFDLLQVLWTHAMWPDYASMRPWLLEGYERVRPLSDRERAHLDVIQAIPLVNWCDRGVAPRDAGDVEDFPKWVGPTLKRIRELCGTR